MSAHDQVGPLMMAAHIRLRGGDVPGAIDGLACAAILVPDQAGIWAGLATLNLSRDAIEAASRQAKIANAISPSGAAHLVRAEIDVRTGVPGNGAAFVGAALALDPALAEAWMRHAQSVEKFYPHRALIAFERARFCGDQSPSYLANRADLLRRLDRPMESRAAACEALSRDPLATSPRLTLASLSLAAGNWREGAIEAASALILSPSDAAAVISLSAGLGRMGHVGPALQWASRACITDPSNGLGWNAKGLALRPTGLAQASFDAFVRARDLAPEIAAIHSNTILAACYLPDDPARDQSLLADFARRFGAIQKRPISVDRRPDRVLRIGYLSGDFRNHPVGVFLYPVLAQHDRSQVAPILYASQTMRDSMTSRLGTLAPIRFVAGLDDRALAHQIAADQIDILIDLSGHTAGNRLPVLALRPAPILLAWGGLVGSTGLGMMDGIIADPIQIPQHLATLYAEPVAYCAPDYACFTPPEFAPDPGPLPCSGGAPVTFGCLNNILKISDETIELWARLLRLRMDARLLMKGPGFDDCATIDRLCRQFERAGIDRARLMLEGPSPPQQFLAAYQRIDVALDPTPYSGGLTTMEALWMGVPVVTLPGSRFTSRHSATHLSAIGLDDWIVADMDAYSARALDAVADPNALSTLRAGLRQRMARSPLCDGRALAAQIEALCRRLWHQIVLD